MYGIPIWSSKYSLIQLESINIKLTHSMQAFEQYSMSGATWILPQEKRLYIRLQVQWPQIMLNRPLTAILGTISISDTYPAPLSSKANISNNYWNQPTFQRSPATIFPIKKPDIVNISELRRYCLHPKWLASGPVKLPLHMKMEVRSLPSDMKGSCCVLAEFRGFSHAPD